jgi:hypothetical protein
MLTKSDYNRYLECPIHLWLHKYRRDALPSAAEDSKLQWIFEQGNLVESYARKLFPDARLVEGHSETSERQTKELLAAGVTTIFQATAIADGLLAMADVLRFDPATRAWDLFEVKSGTKVKKEYLHDVAFQRLAFRKAGYTIGRVFLIHVNSSYVRRGDISPSQLLTTVDVTSLADTVSPRMEATVAEALALLARKDQPTREHVACACTPKDCPCVDHCYPNAPEYSVFHLHGIHAKKARTLYDGGTRHITDVPETFKANPAQAFQLQVARSGRPVVEREKIREVLDARRYPLYFLDYESWNPAVPMFDGYRPYQQMVFQYSLHVLRSPGAGMEHRECLVSELSDPMRVVARHLAEDIGGEGEIIVWNAQFEANRNDEMAAHVPELADFLRGLNGRIFDLMGIFRQQQYVHPAFRGSCSIKDVLPVVAPTLSYKELAIQEGGTASLTWYRMVTDGRGAAERAATCKDLTAYCTLDTLAMVEVFRHLDGIAG